MKKVVSVGLALLVISLASLAAVGVASAQGPQAAPTPQGESLLGRAWGHLREGMGIVSDAIAELLGLTPEEIHAQREEGKTLAEIANEQGITDEALIQAILDGRTEAIEQALADGLLTQEQADWLIAKAEAMAPFQITNPFAPGQGRGRMHDRFMRGGFGRGLCPELQEAPEDSSS